MTVDRTPAHLADMLGFVRELRAMLASQTLQAYLGNRMMNLATEKLFINLGEAAQRIGEEERSQMSDVPWRQIIGLRNLLADGHERVEHESLYRTVVTELAAVEQSIAGQLQRRDIG